MSFKHAVVWVDHQEAHIIHFNAEEKMNKIIKSNSKHPHLHHKAGSSGSGHTAADESYLHEIISAVSDAQEILIVGPGSAKLKLVRHASKHDHKVADKIVAVETVDHPSDAQLLAYAKKYFVPVDIMLGDA
jgi:hypothetical protein